MTERISLAEKLASFSETWVPKVVGQLNGQLVKLVKTDGEYLWHHHDTEDELFLVLRGRLDLHFRDTVVELRAGECCIVPRGIDHKPVSVGPAEVLLFEPATTRNTGNLDHGLTIEPDHLDRI